MAQVQSYDIPLHDIKPIVEIEEYSFYYFLGISSIALILVSVVIYFLYMWFKKRKTFNIRKEHFKLLDLLNLQSFEPPQNYSNFLESLKALTFVSHFNATSQNIVFNKIDIA